MMGRQAILLCVLVALALAQAIAGHVAAQQAGQTPTPGASAPPAFPTPTIVVPDLAASPPAVGPWGAPQLISSSEQSGWFPSIAVDDEGGVHVVYSSGRSIRGDDYDTLEYTRRAAAGWSAPIDVFASRESGYAARSSLLAGRDGRLAFLVRSKHHVTLYRARRDQALHASAWREIQAINGGESPYYVLLRQAGSGRLYALWSETLPVENEQYVRNETRCSYCSHIFAATSADNGKSWSYRSDLSPSRMAAARPQAVVDSQDRLHVVWDDGLDQVEVWGQPQSVFYRRYSPDMGWTEPISFTLPSMQVSGREYANAPLQAAIAADAGGNPLVVFRSTLGSTLYMVRSADGGLTWAEPEAIPELVARSYNDTPWDSYSLALDGAGLIHLLAVGYAAGLDLSAPPGLYHLVWDGAQWSAPELITADKRYPEWPRLAIGGNRLHAVWFTRNQDDRYISDRGRYQVWYAERTIGGPALMPAPTWTPLPTPSPRAELRLAVALTPTPTPVVLSGNAPLANRWVSDETRALRIGALALIPSLLIIGALFALRRLFHR